MKKFFKHNPNTVRFNFLLIVIAIILSISELQAGKERPLIGILILIIFWAYTAFWESRTPYIVLGENYITINNFFFIPSKKLVFENIDSIENKHDMRFLIKMKNEKIHYIDLKKMDKKQRENFIFDIKQMKLPAAKQRGIKYI